MTSPDLSRRDMLAASARALGTGWIAAYLPAISALAACARDDLQRAASTTLLSADEARAFTAFAAQIIPSDDGPGDTEAGAVYFVDRALGSFFSGMTDVIRTGLRDLDTRAKNSGAGNTGAFADLPPARQIVIMKEIEQTPFFGTARMLTLMGTFADPSYGGNRDHLGFALLQIDHQPTYSPPFGYYDAEVARAKAGASQ
jgi:gluconate 2-dehydrogenase gamma chain